MKQAKVLARPAVAVFTLLEEKRKQNKSVTATSVLLALEKMGYKANTIRSAIISMKKEGAIEVFDGTGNPKDPELIGLSAAATTPEAGAPYRPFVRRTKVELEAERYKLDKEAREIEKKAINKTKSTVPATLNNSLASELERVNPKNARSVVDTRPAATSRLAIVPKRMLDKNTTDNGLTLAWNGTAICVREARKMYHDLFELFGPIVK